MHHPTDRITHTMAFVTPVVEHWLEREIAQWVHPMKDRSDDPSHHERTLLPRSYISLLVVIGDYNVGMVCYSLTNPISFYEMLMVVCVITMTSMPGRIDEAEGVSRCGAGSDIITMMTSGITFCKVSSFPFISIGIRTHFIKTSPDAHSTCYNTVSSEQQSPFA